MAACEHAPLPVGTCINYSNGNRSATLSAASAVRGSDYRRGCANYHRHAVGLAAADPRWLTPLVLTPSSGHAPRSEAHANYRRCAQARARKQPDIYSQTFTPLIVGIYPLDKF